MYPNCHFNEHTTAVILKFEARSSGMLFLSSTRIFYSSVYGSLGPGCLQRTRDLDYLHFL